MKSLSGEFMNAAILYIVLILYNVNYVEAATVKQILNEQNLVIVTLQAAEEVKRGKSLLISKDDKVCLLEAINVDERIVVASTKKCLNVGLLVVGAKAEIINVEPVIVPQANLNKSMQKSNPNVQESDGIISSKKYSALVVGYMITPSVKISGEYHSGGVTEVGSLEYKFKNAFRIGYEWSQFKERSWNHGFLVDYTNLMFDSITLSGNISGSLQGTATGRMSIITTAYAAKYRLEKFYFPIGIGFASSAVSNAAEFPQTMQARLYVSAGGGVVITEKFNLEGVVSSYSVLSRTVSDGSDAIVPLGIGWLTSVQLNLKILF